MAVILKITRGLKKKLRAACGINFELGKFKVGSQIAMETPCEVSSAADLCCPFSLGAYSSISPTDAIGKTMHQVSIGRYCNIAAGCWIAPHEHPISWLTTDSVVYARTLFNWHEKFSGAKIPEPRPYVPTKPVTIGNDVWVGSHVFVKGGVKIGDGAVVAAHAVVTKDVPPYAIVGGCPAKVIRMRFDEQTIRELQELRWWDYDLAAFGPLDWSDVPKAIATIRTRIREGLRPFAPRVVTEKDLRPYSCRTLFFCSCSRRMVRLKLFGVWIVHWVGRCKREMS